MKVIILCLCCVVGSTGTIQQHSLHQLHEASKKKKEGDKSQDRALKRALSKGKRNKKQQNTLIAMQSYQRQRERERRVRERASYNAL